jgi:outer membrane protein TolC
LEAGRLDAVLSAASGYFDLVKARAMVDVTRESIQILRDYQKQLHEAVATGIAFRGDELRVQTQTEQNEIVLQQASERQRITAVTLAQVLHLDPKVELVPLDTGLTPLKVLPDGLSMNSLVDQALRNRPELKRSEALLAASRTARNGALYGSLIPGVGAQVFAGGLGGGPDGAPSNLGPEGDYTVGLSWRIGPGGLFDPGRIHASKARLQAAEFADSKLKDLVAAQVVSALVRVNSTATQIELAQRNLKTAKDALELTRQRKQFGVGVVLEDIQAAEALTQARADYVTAVTEHEKAQYALTYAVGEMPQSDNAAASPGVKR